MQHLRLLIADDHEIVRSGLRATLESRLGWEVAWEATTGREAVALCLRVRPDVCLLDISMPELNGIEACRQLVQQDREIRVLILSVYDSEDLMQAALDAGALGYVSKTDPVRDLLSAVEAVSQGQPFLTAKAGAMLLREWQARRQGAPGEKPGSVLSVREREVLQLLAEGKTNKEIALALGISAKTAETHRHNIMQKLGINSVVGLVRYAIRNRITLP